jgi:hypothetical protein
MTIFCGLAEATFHNIRPAHFTADASIVLRCTASVNIRRNYGIVVFGLEHLLERANLQESLVLYDRAPRLRRLWRRERFGVRQSENSKNTLAGSALYVMVIATVA